jgi:hypothetical protein
MTTPQIFTASTTNTFMAFIDGHPYQTDYTVANREALDAAVEANDAEAIKTLCSPQAALQAALAETDEPNVHVEIRNGRVYFDGYVIQNALTQRMLQVQQQGFKMDSWIKFAAKLYSNPRKEAIEEIYLWLEESDLPITDDGDFLAYKRVTQNFKDVHTQTFDNSPGAVVEMPREAVDPVRANLCSTGLHFCSQSYLPHFAPGGKVVLVKINPADVVSIPEDYSNAKGRTWRYEVLTEIDPNDLPEELRRAVATGYDHDDDLYDDDDLDDDYFDDEFDEDESNWEDEPENEAHVHTTWDEIKANRSDSDDQDEESDENHFDHGIYHNPQPEPASAPVNRWSRLFGRG